MKKFTLIGGLVALSIFATACIPQQTIPEKDMEDDSSAAEETTLEEPAVEIAVEPVIEEEATVEAARYIAYSAETLEQLKGSQPVAVFFHAEWCPTCRGMEAEINENLANLPAGTVILKADYDTETELKEQYKIVIQSTIAILDKDGNHVDTLAGATSSEIVEALNNA